MIAKEESFGVIPFRKKNNRVQIFLVQLRSGNHWGFPKGHLQDLFESPKEVAARELKEETNLEIERFISDVSFEETYFIEREKDKVEKKVIYFLAFVKGDFSLQKNEIIDGGWVDFEKVEEKLTYLESKNVWQKVKNFLFSKMI